ncbi:uncharacterized protein LOC121521867 [Cheilinus undulatus]|uniref:uncharacterized protein LOC121521867 n=1 Tax=Cheilinus undulatus TaxID=241271 RepID=UPI001BD2E7EE|nr:uncharacterized protein LOC121521867 [Cheilinus undulatus]
MRGKIHQIRRIKMILFGMLMLLCTAPSAVSGDNTASVTVGFWENVTLPCGNVNKNQQNCDSTSWIYSPRFDVASEELITHGKISSKIAEAKSERLRVKEDCSLVIKHVTREDVGRYTCRQFTPGEQDSDALVFLSVITTDPVDSFRIFCSVFSYGPCEHTIQWYYTVDDNEISVIHYSCSAIVTFTTHAGIPEYDQLVCNVTDKKSGQTLQCDAIFGSCQKSESKGDTSSEKEGNNPPPYTETPGLMLRFIIVSVGFAALILAVVTVSIWTRIKGNKTQIDPDAVQDDEAFGSVIYENCGGHDAPVRIHQARTK